jgi:hypothetical protein
MYEQKYRRMAIQILYFKSGLQPDLAKPTDDGDHHFLYKQNFLEKHYLALTLLMFMHVLYITLLLVRCIHTWC